MTDHLLLLNGNIRTMDPSAPLADALAVRGSRIDAVGKGNELRDLAGGPNWTVIDLGGKTVLPGFVDAHLHFLWYALGPTGVLLDGAYTLQATLNRVKRHIAQTEPGQWVVGLGWNDADWQDGGLPTKEALDAAAPQNPVVLTRKDGHVVWVNSLALQMAGVDESTPDPPGGKIERNEDTGQLVGIFKEKARHLIIDAAPVPGPETRQEALVRAIREEQALGVTGIHDCDGSESLTDYQDLLRRGELGLRVFMMIPRDNLDEAIRLGLRSGFGNQYLRIGTLKIFADGTLGSQTAEMLEPFNGQPDNRGITATSQEELEDLVGRATAAGIACSVHAIGDKANRRVLDAFAKHRSAGLGGGLRHRVEHVQVLDPADISRFKELRIIASMQPIHATSDMDLADEYWGERARWSYAWKSLSSAGARLAFGSDAPVEPLNPLLGIHAAVTRERASGEPEGGWYPQERLSVLEAVHGFTLGAAYASGEEKDKGSISVGKLADLAILSQDIFEIPPGDMLNTRVVATVFDGQIVFGEENL